MVERTTGEGSILKQDRPILMRGASALAMMVGLATPAHAQLAQMRAAAGTPVTVTVPSSAQVVRPANMVEALQRAGVVRDRAAQIRGYATSARDAALAATRVKPTDGISDNGLDPIAAVREAVGKSPAAAEALLVTVKASNDAIGTATWQGATAPTQTTADGKTTVTITQTESRALLSWRKFDIGENTTLNFEQKQAGVAQPGWTAVNRVVNSTAPSTILGKIKGDGTVLVLNARGVIFGQNSQVNLHSLLISTLEIGNYGRNFQQISTPNGTVSVFDALSLADRNANYLQNGLFTLTSASPLTAPPFLLAPLFAAGTIGRNDALPPVEGSITIDPGASITAGTGGFIIAAAPEIRSSGTLTATEGQVSLQGGRFITAVQSTGDSTSVDPTVRGLILRTAQPGRSTASSPLNFIDGDGVVINRGLIEAKRGYISLGAGISGEVTNAGLLASTTSVSRNGTIWINAGKVTIAGAANGAPGGGIEILPDANGETIPQGTVAEPPSFKTSQIQIGARADAADVTNAFGTFLPSLVTLGQDSLILAPSADVVIGRAANTVYDPLFTRIRSGIDMRAGAVIDVSGIKDLNVDIARNSLTITPVKRNELRDTPTYRETTTDGSFTLNGKTITVDIRRSGVREDGVAWIGSPLIEAGSLASQIPLTAAELMTTGGTVSMGVNLLTDVANAADAPSVRIAKDARIDFSGGWIHYGAGVVTTSKLVASDGRLVDIGDADPNDIYVAVADGFTAEQPRFAVSSQNADVIRSGGTPEAGYDEGRDAGALTISASASQIDGTFYGNAFAGARQTAGGMAPSLTASGNDPRRLQQTPYELPSGGLLRIGSFTGSTGTALGGDIIVYRGTREVADTDLGQSLLSDNMLSAAGLSALTLQTSGQVSFASGSLLDLAPGGTLTVDAGRSIRFDGTVRAPSGHIAARTYELATAPIVAGSFSAIGSPFRTDDDIAGLYATIDAAPVGLFDIRVGGTLTTAGLWTNAALAPDNAGGKAWLNGGSISLTVAPKVLVAVGASIDSAQKAADLSGSILINPGALLNVSAGGYVAADRSLDLSGAGGDVSLINETTYAATVKTLTPDGGEDALGTSERPIAGTNQAVDFTPGVNLTPALVPDADRLAAKVSIASGTIKGFGFTGGGTFRLVSPDIRFDSETSAPGTHIPLSFLADTGFGTLDLTSFRSRIVSDLFTNSRTGNSAFFETTSLRIARGQTLDLTQTLLPAFLSADQASALRLLASGSDVTALSLLAPKVPVAAWDRRAAHLKLGGLMELVVDQGGAITGAAGGSITAPQIVNDGTIRIRGGSIVQQAILPENLIDIGLGVKALGDVFGKADLSGRFDEDAANALGLRNASGILTNHDLVSSETDERAIYFLGVAGAGEGIRLGAGSVTDVSGVALVDPRAAFLADGTQLVQGRVLQGGTIATSAAYRTDVSDGSRTLFSNPGYGSPRYLNAAVTSNPPIVGEVAGFAFNALPGATIDISGASGNFDQRISPLGYAKSLQWSDGGTLSVLGSGGTIGGAIIKAAGGAAKAVGGTLEWLRPIVRQLDTGVAADNVIFAGSIGGSGFDSLIARGGITFDGTVTLALDKYFAVLSAPALTNDPLAADAAIRVSGTTDTKATVTASYIRFASRLGRNPDSMLTGVAGNALLGFGAGPLGIDFVGASLFDASIAGTRLAATGDLRLTGVDDRAANSNALPVLNGELVAQGNLTFDAARVYATTGTGNLQQVVEDRRNGVTSTAAPYLIAALGASSIRFDSSNKGSGAPLSAGSYLKIQAKDIVQDSFLAAPLGLLEIGSNSAIGTPSTRRFAPATATVTFGSRSTTTVSGDGLNVPYGTTTDLSEYYFSPSVTLPISAPPTGELRVAGSVIDVLAGANVNLHGGGDVFAYEFVSGTGGSRDVLDRFNRDRFSSNGYDVATGTGYQFADQRQVFAIIPASQSAAIAAYDPIYSADYGVTGPVDLYGAAAGRTVTLDGSSIIPAGEYLLLPAHYALLPGAYRIVENVGREAPVSGGSQGLLDGSLVVGGTYSFSGGDFAESQRRSFTVQAPSVFLDYSRIEVTGGSAAAIKRADTLNLATPRLPLDAARAVLSPLEALKVAGVFDTRVATGGRGAQIDIGAANIVLGADTETDVAGSVLLTNSTIAQLRANSLLIGGERSERSDGTTLLNVTANTIEATSSTAIVLPEIILAVGGGRAFENSRAAPELTIANRANLTAIGTLDDTVTGDYVILADGESTAFDRTGVGAVLRLGTGAERLITRTGANVAANASGRATLRVGIADLVAPNLAIDSTGGFVIAPRATLTAQNIALSGDSIRFGGNFIQADLEAQLAAASRLTLRSSDAIGFASGTHNFKDLVIDSGGIALLASEDSSAVGNVILNAGSLTLGNKRSDLGACAGAGIRSCSVAGATLAINATSLALDSGTVRTYGFDGAVAVKATNGIYVQGKGSLEVAKAKLSLTAPFVADRAIAADPRDQNVLPDYRFGTTGAISLVAPTLAASAAQPAPVGNRAPGARIAFGSIDAPAASVTIDGASVLATAGIIDVRAKGDVRLAGAASLSTPGYSKTFGDDVDSTIVSAGAGTINLVSLTGDIVLPSTAKLIVDSYDGPNAAGVLDQNDGQAGALNLIASRGSITLDAALNPGVKGTRDASFTFDSGKSAFDLSGFVTRYGTMFQGDIAIRSGANALALTAGQTLRAKNVSLAAEAGAVRIAGTIDTSGVNVSGMDATAAAKADVNGGDIELYGQDGVLLSGTAKLDTHTTGYADSDTRSAKAGDVRIGIGAENAAIRIDATAVIDVSARRTEAAIAAGKSGNRLVGQTVKDPVSLADRTVFHLVEADAGGSVSLRAPVLDQGGKQLVDVRLPDKKAIVGASSIEVEGFRRYDIDALAESGLYLGVANDGAKSYLDFGIGYDEGYADNILAGDFVTEDGLQSVVHFVRNFQIAAKDGSDLTALRLRPGVELYSKGDLDFLTNWNLGAGEVDQAAALAAKVLVSVPQLNFGSRIEGAPYLAVAAGREAELLEKYTNMYYRVGGRIDGEAPVVTIRAGGNLRSEFSITDGFFLFQDRTDPFYVNYQLGGGDRQLVPAATFTCATVAIGDCGNTIGFLDYLRDTGAAEATNSAAINLSRVVAGSDVAPTVLAPYSGRANSPGAMGALDVNEEEYGDPVGNMDLFPLLNGGTTAVKSSGFRLVGGAGPELSVDPLHVDRATAGNVAIAGEHSYEVVATAGEASQYVTTGGRDARGRLVGDYQLQLRITPSADGASSEFDYLYAPAGSSLIDFVQTNGSSSGLGELDEPGEVYTVLSWGGQGSAQSIFVRDKALAFFELISPATFDVAAYEALTPAERNMRHVGVVQGNPRAPTGVSARLSDVLAFLDTIGKDVAKNVVTGAFAADAPKPADPVSYGLGTTAYYGTVVRSGDGRIDMAAANDVRLLRTDTVAYRTSLNRPGNAADAGQQVGGTAVYTAGHIATQAALTASTAAGDITARISWGDQPVAVAIDKTSYLPSIRGQFLQDPALLTDGGAIRIVAGGDVIGRRDVWAETYLGAPASYTRNTLDGSAVTQDSFARLAVGVRDRIGAGDQLWRVGGIGQDSVIGIVPQLFTAGVGALAGGDVTVKAGGDVRDLTIALDNSVVTANAIGSSTSTRVSATNAGTRTATAPIQLGFGSGDLSLVAGGDLLGGQIDIASGAADLAIGGNVLAAGLVTSPAPVSGGDPNELRLRLSDARISMTVRGFATIAGISALGASSAGQAGSGTSYASFGHYSAISGFDLVSGTAISLTGSRNDQAAVFDIGRSNAGLGFVLPASLALVSLTDDIALPSGAPYLLYPSVIGQLDLLAGGDIDQLTLAMSDSDPSLLPGAFSAFGGNVTRTSLGNTLSVTQGLAFGFPGVTPTTSDATLRLYHNERTTHAGDSQPVRIYADGSITDSVITLPKQARIGAGIDLLDVYFVGQNVNASDVTRITAGRDITGSTASSISASKLPFVVANSFALGGPGTFYVEAGRNLGPFINSAVVNGVSYAGGIRTVGNDFNPWLAPQSANIFALFGVSGGVAYDALRETYLNPANAAKLDGDLFEQVKDDNDNLRPDRTQPIYAPVLAGWLRDNEPALFAKIFPGQSFPDTDTGNGALTQAAYGKFQALYDAFASLGTLRQRQFLINDVYFNELAQVATQDGPSFQQSIRGYRAIQTLFPAPAYTDNLATFTTDPATVNDDHPLGVPTKKIVDGQPMTATRKETGNVDLRLATIGSTRGGDVTIMGPGGEFIAGSVVRTSEQAARRDSRFGFADARSLEFGAVANRETFRINAIPLGFEGVLTLRGGQIRSFSDGDFRLNQSRLFTLGGGDITMWSSNGDLNAGQGPKSASNFPPITIRFDQNGLTEVNSTGSVSGAGIGAFKRTPTDAAANILLIAPAGEVDAGDAGVRASGNISVFAPRIANADNVSAGGTVSGVPTGGAAAAPAVPASSASSAAAQAALAQNEDDGQRRTLISVDVLGFGGTDPCADPNSTDPSCR